MEKKIQTFPKERDNKRPKISPHNQMKMRGKEEDNK